ncbi:hypothetical protein HYH02_010361 [Chlamydomonas schloesseri]|uniref:Cytochrome P450 n=1 Tax=Chlamydomonas schloesseri TaxID=2026947 RepID=A0A835T7R9_9CHLO|nr:hypothetical protein HYH02_010361 [Chlamydomonas schloesseri]|eukprot:KAG2440482.1 hypothetical protein HYH02_010361 [Chlamydomonas schloesseri]
MPAELLLTLLAAVLVAALMLLRRGKRLSPRFRIPLVGDMMSMSKDTTALLYSRYKELGPVFTLDLVGSTYYVVADPEAQRRYLYRTEGAVPDVAVKSYKMLVGVVNPAADHALHPIWRKATLAAVGPQGLQALFPAVLQVMQGHVRRWVSEKKAQDAAWGDECGGGGQVRIFRAARVMGLDLAIDVVAGVQLPQSVDRTLFKKQVEAWLDGFFGMPLALPGTKLAKALAAKEWLLSTLSGAIRGVHDQFSKQVGRCERE